MKIVIDYPPNIKDIKSTFNLTGNEIFTYGDTIYNPGAYILNNDLIRHEEVHQKQQGTNPQEWWDKYLLDPKFRLIEEIKAHKVQYQEACKVIKDRNKRNYYLQDLLTGLCGETYGNMINRQKAIKLIK